MAVLHPRLRSVATRPATLTPSRRCCLQLRCKARAIVISRASYAVGIDLGTSTSAVAVIKDGRPVLVRDAGGPAIIPSIVAYNQASKQPPSNIPPPLPIPPSHPPPCLAACATLSFSRDHIHPMQTCSYIAIPSSVTPFVWSRCSLQKPSRHTPDTLMLVPRDPSVTSPLT